MCAVLTARQPIADTHACAARQALCCIEKSWQQADAQEVQREAGTAHGQ